MSHKKGLVGAQIKRVSEMIQEELRDGELSVGDAEAIAAQARAVFTDRIVTVDTVMNIYHKGAAGITGEEMEEKGKIRYNKDNIKPWLIRIYFVSCYCLHSNSQKSQKLCS